MSIVYYTKSIGLRDKIMAKRWTNSEIEYIRTHADTLKDKELVFIMKNIFHRDTDIQSVRGVRKRIGIKKINGRGKCGIRSSS